MLNVSNSTLRAPEECPVLNVLGLDVQVLANGTETGGQSTITKMVCHPGPGAPVHRHPHSENFFVLKGELTVLIESDWHRLSEGQFAHIHSGSVHAFRNDQATAAEFINMATPAGHDLFFKEIDAHCRSGPPDMQAVAKICRDHQIELIPEE